MPKPDTASPPVQFTCEHCGTDVPWLDAGLNHYEHRNQCPHCMHSKHIMFGTPRQRPCGALMPPVKPIPGITFYTSQCDGCGYQWVTYDEDWWATLTPDQQTAAINHAYTRTEQLNGQPVVTYTPHRKYRTEPPPIPAKLLGTRKRAERRP